MSDVRWFIRRVDHREDNTGVDIFLRGDGRGQVPVELFVKAKGEDMYRLTFALREIKWAVTFDELQIAIERHGLSCPALIKPEPLPGLTYDANS